MSCTFEAHYLPQHVFLCASGRHYVFLDLKQDRYFCLSRAEFESQDALQTAPVSHAERMPETLSASSCLILNDLVRKGLLTTNAQDGKVFVPVKISTPTESLQQSAKCFRTPRTSPSVLIAFMSAAMSAYISLRYHDIQSVVEHQRDCRAAGGTNPADWTRICELVGAFATLRFHFPKNYLCLFDSLALLRFLATYRSLPTWVFGVRAEPFAAHCWLQQGTVVLNDTLERIRPYTPIMTV